MTKRIETLHKVELVVDPYGKLYVQDDGVLTELRLHVDGGGYAYTGNVVTEVESDD